MLARHAAPQEERLPSLRELLIGRDADLERLALSAEPGRVVVVVGEAGVGKTALLRAFMQERANRSIVLSGRCREREHVPFKGLDEALLPLLQDDLAALSLSAERLERIRALFPDYLLGATRPLGDATSASALRALREALNYDLQSEPPWTLCLEDVQWAPAETLEAICHLAAGGKLHGTLLLTLRSAHRQAVEELFKREDLAAYVTWIEIEPLSPTHAASMAARLVPSQSADHQRALARASAGNPWALRALAEAGDLSVTSYDELIERRIGVLGETERAVLLAASVARHGIPLNVLTKALDLAALPREVHALRRSGLLGLEAQRLGLSICVPDLKVSALALRAFEEPEVIRMNRRLADALSEAGAPLEQLLYHYRESGQFIQAIECAERAGHEAKRRGERKRARCFFEEALELEPPALETRRRIEQELASLDGGRLGTSGS